MKKIIAIVAAGLISILLVGCGPEKLNLQPDMSKVMNMSKKDAVNYLNNIESGKDCTFYEDYLTIKFVGAGKSGKYSSAGFVQSKNGNEYTILVVLPSEYSTKNVGLVYRGTDINVVKNAINALDKLGVLIH